MSQTPESRLRYAALYDLPATPRPRITEDEKARLLQHLTDRRTLTVSAGGDRIHLCSSNEWALDLLAEWRGLTPQDAFPNPPA